MWLIEFVVIVGAALDVLLAAALCYYLSFWRADTFRRQAELRPFFISQLLIHPPHLQDK
jgi:hypothetical protein